MKALSGGERNRLLLARLFTRPANVLVLDEPTNDLDIETLELLEAQLLDWPGTLLLVSHDRAFLDNVVTSTLVFEGDGRVQEYVGGYADWLRQRDSIAGGRRRVPRRPPPPRSRRWPGRRPARRRKHPRRRRWRRPESGSPIMSSRSFCGCPTTSRSWSRSLATSAPRSRTRSSTERPVEVITGTLARQEALQVEVQQAYERWSDLDARARR